MIERVLICTQTFPPKFGGMEAVMYSLANWFSQNHIETLVATDKPFRELSKFEVCSFNVPRFMRSFTKRVSLDIRSFNPDITVCDSWKSVAAVPKHAGKVVVLAHGQEYLEVEKKADKIRSALKRADLIVASSNMTAGLVQKIYSDTPVEVVYPTYMLNIPHADSRTANQIPIICSICRIEARKGLLQSADALISLRKSGIRFKWKIAGTGPALELLSQKISGSIIEQDTEMLGRIDDNEKQQLLSQTDLFLMPSYQAGNSLEGFGISYIEAASYAVPAIAGNIGGAPEAVLDQQTGWCINGQDPEAIEAALKDALTNNRKREQLGKAAQHRFQNELVGQRVFEKLRALLINL